MQVWTSVTVDTCNTIILRQLLGYCPGLENLLVKGADALSDKLFLDIWRVSCDLFFQVNPNSAR